MVSLYHTPCAEDHKIGVGPRHHSSLSFLFGGTQYLGRVSEAIRTSSSIGMLKTYGAGQSWPSVSTPVGGVPTLRGQNLSDEGIGRRHGEPPCTRMRLQRAGTVTVVRPRYRGEFGTGLRDDASLIFLGQRSEDTPCSLTDACISNTASLRFAGVFHVCCDFEASRGSAGGAGSQRGLAAESHARVLSTSSGHLAPLYQ
jgi:hypothetical protein